MQDITIYKACLENLKILLGKSEIMITKEQG